MQETKHMLPSAANGRRVPYVMASTVMIMATGAVAVAFAAVGNLLYMFVSLNIYSPFLATDWDAEFKGDLTVKAYTLVAKSWGIVSCKANGNFPANVTHGAGPGFVYDITTSPYDQEEYAQYTWSPTMPVAWFVNWFFVFYCGAVFRKFNKPFVLVDFNSSEVLGVVKIEAPMRWIKAFLLTIAHAVYLNEFLFVIFYLLYLLIAYEMENMKCTGLYGQIVANIYRCGGCASLSTWLLVRLSYRGGFIGGKRPVLTKPSRGLIVYLLYFASFPVLAVTLHVTGALGAQSWIKCTIGYALLVKLMEWTQNLSMGFVYRKGKTNLEDLMRRLGLGSLSFLVSVAVDASGQETSSVLGGIINPELLNAVKNPWQELPSCKANSKFNELRIKLIPSAQRNGVVRHNALDPSKPEIDIVLPLTQTDLFMKDKPFQQYFGFSHQVVYEFGASNSYAPAPTTTTTTAASSGNAPSANRVYVESTSPV